MFLCINHTDLSHLHSLPLITSISFVYSLFCLSWYLIFWRDERSHFPMLFFCQENPPSAASHSLSAISHLKTPLNNNTLSINPLILGHQKQHLLPLKGVRRRVFSQLSYLSPFFQFFVSLLYSFFAEQDAMKTRVPQSCIWSCMLPVPCLFE